MSNIHFRVPLLNNLRIGPYELPFRTNSSTQEWLIVSRQKDQSSFLTISDTSTPVEPGSVCAPEGLMEQNTIVAVLAEEDGDRSQFLMLRHLPEGVRISGRFFPADGAATLEIEQGSLKLSAFGRHAHSRGSSDAGSVLHDIPNPAPNAESAANWHFSAEERSWSSLSKRRENHEIQ